MAWVHPSCFGWAEQVIYGWTGAQYIKNLGTCMSKGKIKINHTFDWFSPARLSCSVPRADQIRHVAASVLMNENVATLDK